MEWDFTANAVVEDVAKVPEGYRGLYVKGEGENANKFVVGPFAKGITEAYMGVGKALKETTAAKTQANQEAATRRVALKAFADLAKESGITFESEEKLLDAFKAHITDLTGKVKNGQEIKVDLDKIRGEHATRVAEVEKNANEKVGKMQTSLERYLVGEAATAALAANKGSIELLLPHVKTQCKVVQDGEDFVVRVVDASGAVRTNGKGGMMTVADLVAEMKTKDAFARAFESEVASGSGHRPGSSQRQPLRTDNKAEMSSTDKIAAGLAAQRK